MATYACNSKTTHTLSLTTTEALFIKEMVQNPLFNHEAAENTDLRQSIFEALPQLSALEELANKEKI